MKKSVPIMRCQGRYLNFAKYFPGVPSCMCIITGVYYRTKTMKDNVSIRVFQFFITKNWNNYVNIFYLPFSTFSFDLKNKWVAGWTTKHSVNTAFERWTTCLKMQNDCAIVLQASKLLDQVPISISDSKDMRWMMRASPNLLSAILNYLLNLLKRDRRSFVSSVHTMYAYLE